MSGWHKLADMRTGSTTLGCGGLEVGEFPPTLLLVDDGLGVKIDPDDKNVAESVGRATSIEDKRIFEWDLLCKLHHTKDDDQIGAASRVANALVFHLPEVGSVAPAPACLFAGPYICGLTILIMSLREAENLLGQCSRFVV